MVLNLPTLIPLDVEYRFTEAYGVEKGQSLSNIDTVCKVWQQIVNNSTVGALYQRFKFVSSPVRFLRPI